MNEVDPTFVAARPRLFGIAYRMLGTIVDAEDVVQDTWLRWHRTNRDELANPSAYLTRIVTNLSIDALRRLKAERSAYEGPWLPQPIIEEIGATPAEGEDLTMLAETLSIALLAMLESVPPNERATFVLREAFEMSFEDIAACLGAKSATCRQWSKRARDRLAGVTWNDNAPGVERDLLERFVLAMAANDSVAVLELLDPNVTLISDGGGKIEAAKKPLHGVRAVSRFLHGIAARVQGQVGGRLARINGGWGGLATINGKLDSVYSIRCEGAKIVGVYILRNPDKIALLENHTR